MSSLADLTTITRETYNVSGGFTGGLATTNKYGKLIIVRFSCYYNGPLSANTYYTPFKNLPPAINEDIKSITNTVAGDKCVECWVDTSGNLKINSYQAIPANEYITGSFSYFTN